VHKSTVYVLPVLLISCMFQHCRRTRGSDSKISFKQTAMRILQQTYLCFDTPVQVWLKLLYI